MERKLLFLDLDGTLLNDQKEVTPGNRQAIERALSRGHGVVVASGRPLCSALAHAERLGLAGKGCFVIAYNGGEIYDCAAGSSLFRQALAREDLYALFDEANRRGVHIQTYDESRVVVERRGDDQEIRDYCRLTGMSYRVVEDIRQGLAAPTVKALMSRTGGRAALEEMKQWIALHLDGRVNSFFSSEFFLEAVSAGIDKGAAVKALCQRLNVPLENTVAAGDEANDIPMIRAAGVGAAMKNASDQVKAAADYVTRRDNNQDGVAEIIETFLT